VFISAKPQHSKKILRKYFMALTVWVDINNMKIKVGIMLYFSLSFSV